MDRDRKSPLDRMPGHAQRSGSPNPLLGSWILSAFGVRVLTLIFRKDGSLTASAMGISTEGFYDIHGDRVSLKTTDPRVLESIGSGARSLTFRTDGDKLTLDGVALTRS